jgi:hypothetical protein
MPAWIRFRTRLKPTLIGGLMARSRATKEVNEFEDVAQGPLTTR